MVKTPFVRNKTSTFAQKCFGQILPISDRFHRQVYAYNNPLLACTNGSQTFHTSLLIILLFTVLSPVACILSSTPIFFSFFLFEIFFNSGYPPGTKLTLYFRDILHVNRRISPINKYDQR